MRGGITISSMKAVWLTALKTLEAGECKIPEVSEGQVLVRICHTGICGSDLHFYEHGRIADTIAEFPFILGHESAGIVEEVGAGVKNLKRGDRVTMEPGYTCGKCEFCKTGRYNLCPDVIFFAYPPVQGTMCEYVAHPADMCFKLPDNVDTLEGALVEPLAVGFHAAMQGGAGVGKTAMVTGCGCIGLVTQMALRSMGVGTVYMSDTIDVRMDKARAVGAKEVWDVSKCNPVEELMFATHGTGVDIVIETSGSSVATTSTTAMVKRGGTIVQVGMAPDPFISMNIGELMGKEATLKTVFRYRNLYPTAIAAIAAGLPISSIVSDTFTFADSAKAFDHNVKNKVQVVKAVIEY